MSCGTAVEWLSAMWDVRSLYTQTAGYGEKEIINKLLTRSFPEESVGSKQSTADDTSFSARRCYIWQRYWSISVWWSNCWSVVSEFTGHKIVFLQLLDRLKRQNMSTLQTAEGNKENIRLAISKISKRFHQMFRHSLTRYETPLFAEWRHFESKNNRHIME